MKTANVSKAKVQENNNPAVLKKVSVNPALLSKKQLVPKPANKLSVQGYELREWLEHLNDSNGLYFLDIGKSNTYSLHFKHHVSGKVMELDCQEESQKPEDILKALLFDLSLFPEEPILTFDSDNTQTILRNLAATYYEHRREIEGVIGRLVNIDLKKVFESGMYRDTRIKEVTVDNLYHALYPGSSRTFAKEQASYGIYLIFAAMQSIFYQIIGKQMIS